MNTNPSDRPGMVMHDLKFTSDQVMMIWQLTETAKPNGGQSADILTGVRNRLRLPLFKIRKSIEAMAADDNDQQIAQQRKPEMVSSGRCN